MRNQRVDDFVELALHDAVQLVKREIDPMIGQPPLGEIIGADALTAIAAADHQFARRGDL